ncbi:hypothetical protein O1M63_18710 [Streptomyces mirabilis]|nr:hypothetical protein [Streptomyces mirabilis]
MTYHVRMQFTPDGPAVEGTWANPDTALGRYREWVGSHGSLPEVKIVLAEEPDDGRLHTLRTWTKEHGEEKTPEQS